MTRDICLLYGCFDDCRRLSAIIPMNEISDYAKITMKSLPYYYALKRVTIEDHFDARSTVIVTLTR